MTSKINKKLALISNRFPIRFLKFLGSRKTENPKKSLEGLLKIKDAAFMPGTPFRSKTSPFGVHFGTKYGPRNYQKHIKKLDAKIYKKCAQKDLKTTPKWLPESTPGSPKWRPNV